MYECKALWVGRTCSSIDLSTCLPGLTGQKVNILYQGIMGIPYLFTCQPVNLSTRVYRKEVNIGVQSIMGISHLSTCRPVNLSTRVDRSRGNIGVQGIKGNPYLFTCRPANLSTRVDRSRGKYRKARDSG